MDWRGLRKPFATQVLLAQGQRKQLHWPCCTEDGHREVIPALAEVGQCRGFSGWGKAGQGRNRESRGRAVPRAGQPSLVRGEVFTPLSPGPMALIQATVACSDLSLLNSRCKFKSPHRSGWCPLQGDKGTNAPLPHGGSERLPNLSWIQLRPAASQFQHRLGMHHQCTNTQWGIEGRNMWKGLFSGIP